MELNFVVDGEPVAQGRPRFTRIGGFVRAYDPKKSKDYKKQIATAAVAAMAESKTTITGKPLSAEIYIFVGIPKSKSKKFKAAAADGDVLPTVRPDVDNLAKIVLDALNGIVYEDDKQVITLFINKKYSEYPRIEVKLNEIANCDD